MTWIEDASRQYTETIRTNSPQFLIELELSEQEENVLFNHLSREPGGIYGSRNRAAWAIAAVRCAADADQDEGGFRDSFYARLHRPFDQQEWDNYLGPRIRLFLEETFPDVELPAENKPYCYVGSIYRHAGVPSPSRRSFFSLVDRLIEFGPAFTLNEYRESLGATVTSALTCRFLESDAGYRFSQHIAALVLRLKQGVPQENLFAGVPAYRRKLALEALNHVTRDRSAPEAGYGLPALCLDAEDRRLILRFDLRGVNAGIYIVEGSPVLYPVMPVRTSEQLTIVIARPKREEWPVKPWWTAGSGSALFSVANGALKSNPRDLSPADYFLITDVPAAVPTDMILEDAGFLDLPEDCISLKTYSIFRVHLPPGTNIDALEIRVRGDAPTPEISFADVPGLTSMLGSGIYERGLPAILLNHCPPEARSNLVLGFRQGSIEKYQPVPADSDRIGISAPCPSQGEVWLEQSTRNAVTRISSLEFTVVPPGLQVKPVEDLTAASQLAHVKVVIPANWRFDCKDGNNQGSGIWSVPPGTRVLDGRLQADGLVIPVSIRIPRSGIELSSRTRGRVSVLWEDELRGDSTMEIEGLAGQMCDVSLISGKDQIPIGQVALPKTVCVKGVRAYQFLDALETSALPAAEFALHFERHPLICTGRYYASSRRICETLENELYDSAVFRLPIVGSCLQDIHRLSDEPIHFVRAKAALSENRIKVFICDIVLQAITLDGTKTDVNETEVVQGASKSVVLIINWYRDACHALEQCDDSPSLPEAYRKLQLDNIYTVRWRKTLEALYKALGPDEIADMVMEWRNSIRQDPFAHPYSRIASKPGGQELTTAAQKYYLAFRKQSKTRQELFGLACGEMNRLLETRTSDKLVQFIACAILQLGYYHSNRKSEARNIEIPCLPPSLQILSCSMKALSNYCGATHKIDSWRKGIGFAELSPVQEDEMLERDLGRPYPGNVINELRPDGDKA
jgi:hypothetical protein